jgi:hypothetical protein
MSLQWKIRMCLNISHFATSPIRLISRIWFQIVSKSNRVYGRIYRVSNNNCYSWQKKILHKIFKTVNCTYFGLFY